MNPSPYLPILSLLLLLLPALPVQAWFVRLLILILIRASPNKNTKLTLFFSHKQNCVQGSLNSGAGRCLGNGPDFPLKFTCHLVRFFFHTQRSESIRRNSGGGGKEICRQKADVQMLMGICIGWKMFAGWKWMYAG